MKTKSLSLFVCLLLATAALSAATRTVNLASFTGDTKYTTVTSALAASGSGDTVFVAAGVYAEAELTIPAGVIVIGGLPAAATVSSSRIYPGKPGITKADQTILNGGGGFYLDAAGDSITPHRVATVNGTLSGCVVLNGYSATQGGGVLINTTGTVQNCFIRGNQCQNKSNTGNGGGAYLLGSAKLLNCVVDFNMAQQGFAVAIAGAGIATNNTIANNCNAPTWVKITAGTANKFPYNNLLDNHTYDTWFANDYYLAQTETTAAQYAVFANATQMPNATSPVTGQKVFSTGEREAKYNWNPSGVPSDAVGFNCELCAYNGRATQYLNGLWVTYAVGMEKMPMANMTWYGALAYSQWIGGGLPTDAEWEFAARRTTGTGTACYSNNTYAGTSLGVTTPPTPGAQDYMWYGNTTTATGNATTTQAVATKLPTIVGLYDMSGNIEELCASWYNTLLTYGVDPTGGTTGTSRVRRGGAYVSAVAYVTVTSRFGVPLTSKGIQYGFRPKVQ